MSPTDSKQKLGAALREAGAPADMVIRAVGGYYSDYDSPLATPCIQLVVDARAAGLEDIARRAMAGEFDATREESDAWYEREGRRLVKEAGLPESAFEKREDRDA
jgi:hypothetical protein